MHPPPHQPENLRFLLVDLCIVQRSSQNTNVYHIIDVCEDSSKCENRLCLAGVCRYGHVKTAFH